MGGQPGVDEVDGFGMGCNQCFHLFLRKMLSIPIHRDVNGCIGGRVTRYLLRVVWVAHFVEASNKIVKAILLKSNTHVELVVFGSRTMELPTTGNLNP